MSDKQRRRRGWIGGQKRTDIFERALTLLLLALLLPLGACDGAGVDDFDAGPDATAETDTADSTTDAAEDAEPLEDAAEEELVEDDGGGGCPPLTEDELGLIYAGEPDALLELVTNDTPDGDAFLHEPSDCVDPLDPAVAHLVARMRRTLAATSGGVGLAAPQVGLHRRIFLAQRTDQTGRPVQAFLNPLIVEYSTDTASQMEGCLSVPGANPLVVRSLSVVIDYDLEDAWHVEAEIIGGARFTQAAYAARIVQHEYDHLEGTLIVD